MDTNALCIVDTVQYTRTPVPTFACTHIIILYSLATHEVVAGGPTYSREPPVARGHLSFVGTAEDNKVCDGLRRLTDLLELDKEGLVGTRKHLLAYRTQQTMGISCTHLKVAHCRGKGELQQSLRTYVGAATYVHMYTRTYTCTHVHTYIRTHIGSMTGYI